MANSYILTRGINCRRYFNATVEADSPEDAFDKGKAMLHPDHAKAWLQEESYRVKKPLEDLIDPTEAAEESLAVFDADDDEILIEFTAVPNAAEPSSYSDLIALVRHIAAMADVPDFDLMDDDRIESEVDAWRTIIGKARDLIRTAEA